MRRGLVEGSRGRLLCGESLPPTVSPFERWARLRPKPTTAACCSSPRWRLRSRRSSSRRSPTAVPGNVPRTRIGRNRRTCCSFRLPSCSWGFSSSPQSARRSCSPQCSSSPPSDWRLPGRCARRARKSLHKRRSPMRDCVWTETYDGRVAKLAVTYACTECGYSSGRWFGKCPSCGEFGTLAEEDRAEEEQRAGPKPLLRLVDVQAEEAARIRTGVTELDRVLGGGLVPASLVLVGGEPGVGKSTLLLTALAAMSKERRALLVTGEESVAQVKLRAERLGGAERVEVLAETG